MELLIFNSVVRMFCIAFRKVLVIALLMVSLQVDAQTISGYIFDSDNQPVPFANVYVKNTTMGTTSDAQGKYFLRFQDPSMVEIVISSVGYKNLETKILFEHQLDVVKNFWLEFDSEELQEIIVDAKRRDPAYEIIANAIHHKSRWRNQIKSSTCNVYLKAKEQISPREQRRRERKEEEAEIQESNEKREGDDVFENSEKKQEKEIKKSAPNMNMVEVNFTRHFQYPNKVKEIRDAKKQYGDTYGLYYTNTAEVSFNFYDNLMNIHDLNELPLVSPLHITSILTYKFKLEETIFYNDKMLFKIKVTPRKKGNASWEGYIWILDKEFCVLKVDLWLHDGGLYMYDDFNLKQQYDFINDTAVVLLAEEMEYISKTGHSDFKGFTSVKYSNYILNPAFEKRFFNNELAVTTEEAYHRDSTYWDLLRPEPLTLEEQRYQRFKDSLYAVVTSEHYLDSLDSVYNKITLLDVFWDGFSFSNRKKKTYFYFSSLSDLLDPFEIGGLRVGPWSSFFKKWENEKYIMASGGFDIGVRNPQPKYAVYTNYRFDPKHLGLLSFQIGDQNNIIVDNDAVGNKMDRSNWVREFTTSISIRRELFNGLKSGAEIQWQERSDLTKMNFAKNLDSLFGGENKPVPFEAYQELILKAWLSYTPFQKFMTEPYRKVVLGSKWPTFSISAVWGLPKLLYSDVDFAYFTAEITQSFKLGTAGTSSYRIKYGQFLNSERMYYADKVIFPRGDLYFFASDMNSMQIQDTVLIAEKSYLKVHYTHHFNGAIVNYIPLVKKLKIHAATGVAALWVEKSGGMLTDYKYAEIFAGVERTLKVQRSRLRLGLFFVAATSNYSVLKPRLKIAFNFYSMRDQSWTY